jgi:glycyl-tRNA synthetase beta subunit
MPAFLLEVGTEELPAGFLSDAIGQRIFILVFPIKQQKALI